MLSVTYEGHGSKKKDTYEAMKAGTTILSLAERSDLNFELSLRFII